MNPADLLNAYLRKQVELKQRVMAKNIKFRDDAKFGADRRSAQAAINRNEKSIASLISKLLCSHDVQVSGYGSYLRYKCIYCKASAPYHER